MERERARGARPGMGEEWRIAGEAGGGERGSRGRDEGAGER